MSIDNVGGLVYWSWLEVSNMHVLGFSGEIEGGGKRMKRRDPSILTLTRFLMPINTEELTFNTLLAYVKN